MVDSRLAVTGLGVVSLALAGTTAMLWQRVEQLERRTELVVREAGTAVRHETDAQLATFLDRAQDRLANSTLNLVRARRIAVVAESGEDRITFGEGTSEFNGKPNVSIKLTSPGGANPIILSTTDAFASVSVARKAFLGGNSSQGNLGLYFADYAANSKPGLLMIADNATASANLVMSDTSGIPRIQHGTSSEFTRSAIFNSKGEPAVVVANANNSSIVGVLDGPSRFRTALAVTADGRAVAEITNRKLELVYQVQSGQTDFVTTFAKQDPNARLWEGMSTFSTLKTFWDILTK